MIPNDYMIVPSPCGLEIEMPIKMFHEADQFIYGGLFERWRDLSRFDRALNWNLSPISPAP